jgi:hypothetical protein
MPSEANGVQTSPRLQDERSYNLIGYVPIFLVAARSPAPQSPAPEIVPDTIIRLTPLFVLFG